MANLDIITNDNFRFVPAHPTGKSDHIYTDEELYKAFNLPQKYIDIIESVIKENSNINPSCHVVECNYQINQLEWLVE